MKTLFSIFALTLLTGTLTLKAQQANFCPKPVVVACPEQCLPVLCGPEAGCQEIAKIFHQTQLPIIQCCEKVTPCGTVWAKVEIKGWVKVNQNGQRVLRRMMTRDHEWKVVSDCNNLPVLCSGKTAEHLPVSQLSEYAVVKKQSPGLPKCGCMYVCFSGWVVKQCGKQVFLADLKTKS